MLRAGDVVYLARADERADAGSREVMWADGCSDTRVGAVATPTDISPCLFRVCRPLPYTSRKRLAKATAAELTHADSRRALETSAAKEAVAAEQSLVTSVGDPFPVIYGENMQLQHVRSGKFLTMALNTVAEVEKECLRLTLDEQGSEGSWLKVMPRFKTRREGQLVHIGDPLLLRAPKDASRAVHASAEPLSHTAVPMCEVNISSSVATGWKPVLFAPHSDNVSRLLVGDVMRFFHPEAESFVAASATRSKTNPRLMHTKAEAALHKSNFSSKQMWRIESVDGRSGGPLAWRRHCRLLHLLSGRYLAVVGADLEDEAEAALRDADAEVARRNRADGLGATLVAGQSDATLFFFEPLLRKKSKGEAAEPTLRGPPDEFVHEGAVARLVSVATGTYLHDSGAPVPGGRRRRGHSHGIEFTALAHDEDAVTIHRVPNGEVQNVEQVLSVIPVAMEYAALMLRSHDRLRHRRGSSSVAATNSGDGSADDYLLPRLTNAFANLVFAVTQSEAANAFEADGPPVLSTQERMREVKLLDLMLWLLHLPANAGFDLEALNMAHLSRFRDVHLLTYKLLTQAFASNPRSELYVARVSVHSARCKCGLADKPIFLSEAPDALCNGAPGMEEIVNQVGSQVGAETCLQQLLSNNKTLLESCIDDSTLPVFVDLIHNKGPSETFAHFLSALCSCQGMAVTSNQELLLRAVYSGGSTNKTARRELLLQTVVGPNGALYVAWFGSPDWSQDVDELFYDAAELGLPLESFELAPDHEYSRYLASLDSEPPPVQWVALEQLCWVLAPVELAPAVVGKTWNEYSRTMDTEQFELVQQLALYYVAQLHMMANMCRGRSYNCMDYLERQFSYELIVSGINNERLPDNARAAFVSLALRLYVDRFPHDRINAPCLIYNYAKVGQVRNVGDWVVPGVGADEDASKFALLLQGVRGHFEELDGRMVLSNRAQNDLTLASVELLQSLCMYGFLGTVADIEQTCRALLKTLDGHTDINTPKAAVAAAATAVGRKRGIAPAIFRTERTTRRLSIERLTVAAAAGTASGVLVTPDELTAASSRMRRYALTDRSQSIMRSKTYICDVLLQVTDLRLDYRVNKLVSVFKARAKEMSSMRRSESIRMLPGLQLLGPRVEVSTKLKPEDEMAFLSLFHGSDGGVLALDALASHGISLDAILLDLLCYECADLVEAALTLLLRMFTQRSRTVQAAERVQLLTNPMAAHAHEMLSKALAKLRDDVDSYEIWGVANEFSPIMDDVVNEVIDGLESIRKLCTMGEHEDSDQPNTEHQDLLRNLRVYEIIINALRIDESASHLKHIKQLCYQFLAKFVMNHPENQRLMFEHTTFFASQMTVGARSAPPSHAAKPQTGNSNNSNSNNNNINNKKNKFGALKAKLVSNHHAAAKASPDKWNLAICETLRAVFRGNRSLCSLVPQELLYTMASALDGAENPHQFIEFFASVITVGGNSPIRRNQDIVMQVLKDARFRRVLLLYTQGGETPLPRPDSPVEPGQSFEGLLELCNAYTADGAMHPSLHYHIKLVSLLALVSKGKNASGEAMCQALLPLSRVMLVLLDHTQIVPVRAAYARFVADAYFDTEIHDSQLAVDVRVWDLMISLARDVAAATELASISAGGEEVSDVPVCEDTLTCVLQFLLPCIEVFTVNVLHRKVPPTFMPQAREVCGALSTFANCASMPWAGRCKARVVLAALGVELPLPGVVEEAAGADNNNNNNNAGGEVKEPPTIAPLHGAPLGAQLRQYAQLLQASERVQAAMHDEFAHLVKLILTIGVRTADTHSPIKSEDVCSTLIAHVRQRPLKNPSLSCEAMRILEYMVRLAGELPDGILSDADDLPGIESDPFLAALAAKNHHHHRHLSPHHPAGAAVHMVSSVAQKSTSLLKKGLDAITVDLSSLDDTSDEDRAAREQTMQNRITELGGFELVVELVARGGDDAVVEQAVKLGIALLDGGNETVQNTLLEYLQSHRALCTGFFSRIRQHIRLTAQVVKNRRKVAKARAAPERVDLMDRVAGMDLDETSRFRAATLNVFRLLQLMCENHNEGFQDFLRAQPHNRTSINIMQEAVAFLEVAAKNKVGLELAEDVDILLLAQVQEMVTEALQGPNLGNQLQVAASSLVESNKRVLSATYACASAELVKDLKASATRVIASLLEGRNDSLVHAILCDRLDMDLVRQRLVEIHKEYIDVEASRGVAGNWDDEFLAEGFDLLTVANALGEHDPTVRQMMTPMSAVELRRLLRSSTRKVEAIRNESPSSEAAVAPAPGVGEMMTPRRQRIRVWHERQREYAEAHEFFQTKLRSVEIQWNGRPYQISFAKPSECFFLPATSQAEILREVDISTPEDKMKDFVRRAEALHDLMLRIESMSQRGLYDIVRRNLEGIRRLNFAMAATLNLVLVMSLTADPLDHTSFPQSEPEFLEAVVIVLSVCVALTALLMLSFGIANEAPLIAKDLARRQARKQQEALALARAEERGDLLDGLAAAKTTILRYFEGFLMTLLLFVLVFVLNAVQSNVSQTSVVLASIVVLPAVFANNLRKFWAVPLSYGSFWFCTVYDVLTTKATLFDIMYTIASAAGLQWPVGFSFLLFDVVVMNETLTNVVRAVTVPFNQLAMTALLTAIVLYTFGILSFFFFREYYTLEDGVTNECADLRQCFASMWMRGLLSGGGIGESLGPPEYEDSKYEARVAYDLLFFLVVVVGLLNIVFGIIVDTFSALRTAQNERDELLRNTCFVCNIHRSVFDALDGTSFAQHREQEHDPWAYIYFLVYIRNKSATEYTGAESYVAACLAAGDISWIPNGTALCLQESQSAAAREAANEAAKELVEQRKMQAAIDELRRSLDEHAKSTAEALEGLAAKIRH